MSLLYAVFNTVEPHTGFLLLMVMVSVVPKREPWALAFLGILRRWGKWQGPVAWEKHLSRVSQKAEELSSRPQ